MRRLSGPEATGVLAALQASLASGASVSPSLPASLQADRDTRLVGVSVSDTRTSALVAWGTGQGLGAALDAAVALLPRTDHQWLKLDVVTRVDPVVRVLRDGTLSFDRSLTGIAVPTAASPAFLLPEELVARTIVSRRGRLRRGNLERYLRRRGVRLPDAPSLLQPFATQSWFRSGAESFSLYRGHRSVQPVSAERLLRVARRAGDYLARSVSPKGRFAYSYLAKTDRVRTSYNMVRHAGTVYAMFELYQVTRDARLRAAGERALGFLRAAIVAYPKPGAPASALFGEGKLKLGGAALAAVALAKHAQVTGDERSKKTAQRLCRYIVASQDARGRFVHSRNWPGGEEGSFRSEYYDGEALLALMRVYQLDRRTEWLRAAQRGARYLIDVRDRGVTSGTVVHDHWLLYALSELHRAAPSGAYVRHSMLIARGIAAKQKRQAEQPDHVGTYWNGPRSTPVATRSEGLIAALAVARSDSPGDVLPIERAIRLNIAFQLHTVVSAERALYLANPPRSLGGFTRSLTNFEIRIDYVQHNVSALLAWRRVLLTR